MTERYFDKLKIRNRVEVQYGDYYAYSYEDYFGLLKEWVGNINIFIGEKNIYHATINQALNESELKEFLMNYIAKTSQ